MFAAARDICALSESEDAIGTEVSDINFYFEVVDSPDIRTLIADYLVRLDNYYVLY